jgi:hypothetical protein
LLQENSLTLAILSYEFKKIEEQAQSVVLVAELAQRMWE